MFFSNAVLDGVVEGLAHCNPDWGYLSRRINSDITYKKGHLREDSAFMARFAELHLQNFLKESPGVDYAPLALDVERGGYIFCQKGGRIFCYLDGSKDPCAEYDKVVVCDELPVCFEMSLTTKKTGMGRSKGCRRGPKGLSQLLGNFDYLTQRVAPLKNYFSVEQIGYVVVVYPSMINPDAESQQRFSGWGGRLVPFYADKEQYMENIMTFREQHNL